MLGYPHCFADGVSGMILINGLLNIYNLIRQQKYDEIKKIELIQPIQHALDLAFPNGMNSEQESRIHEILINTSKVRNNWKPSLPFVHSERQLRNIPQFRDSSKECFLKLVQKCRNEQITIGSVLVSCLYFGFSKMLGEYQIDLKFDIDVNLRDRFINKLGFKNIGMLVGNIQLNISMDEHTQFWEFARQIHKQINKQLVQLGFR
ncbi:uncharacterized protein containing a nrps condensation domain [Stylonychia lemnae]|uniref:Uncharacterized protein containing a nrps condensation domain n=1 Tax=Stylonychia lemnae TaxID=5949 RepID=A0A077ZTZ2_STYLE|nr:uncharacterized protein containing a nrps condensation domain [Stylonychia lemnae]|eukprot:CDW73044.1 uncharacterized protein containing a nrps condensation domain [Stylonychia lemnae]